MSSSVLHLQKLRALNSSFMGTEGSMYIRLRFSLVFKRKKFETEPTFLTVADYLFWAIDIKIIMSYSLATLMYRATGTIMSNITWPTVMYLEDNGFFLLGSRALWELPSCMVANLPYRKNFWDKFFNANIFRIVTNRYFEYPKMLLKIFQWQAKTIMNPASNI